MKLNHETDLLKEIFDEMKEVTPSPQLKQAIMQRVYTEGQTHRPMMHTKNRMWIAALAGFASIVGVLILIFSYFEISISWQMPKLTFSPMLLSIAGSVMLLLITDLLLTRNKSQGNHYRHKGG